MPRQNSEPHSRRLHRFVLHALFGLCLMGGVGSAVFAQSNSKTASPPQELAIADLNRIALLYVVLMDQSVLDELELSDEQKAQIKTSIDDYKKLNREILANPELSQDIILAHRDEIRSSSEIMKSEILLPRQFERLEQLAFAAQLKSSGNGFNSVLTDPHYSEKFGFSGEQINELKKLSQDAMEDQKEAMQKYRSEIAAIQVRSQKAVWKVLNDEQRELFQKLGGSNSVDK